MLRFPHVRGGVSVSGNGSEFGYWLSPRPWGCFFAGEVARERVAVFPTSVGVFLIP